MNLKINVGKPCLNMVRLRKTSNDSIELYKDVIASVIDCYGDELEDVLNEIRTQGYALIGPYTSEITKEMTIAIKNYSNGITVDASDMEYDTFMDKNMIKGGSLRG